MKQWNRPLLVMAAVMTCSTALPVDSAMAQSALDSRVQKLEKELRAVQRKVFPGGSSRYFEPEISAARPSAVPRSGSASAAVTGGSALTPEMLARIDSLESALQRLTGRIEEQELALSDMRARLDRMDGGPTSAAQTLPTRQPTTARAAQTQPAQTQPAPAPTSKPDPDRIAAVAQIERPSTGDAGEDAYSYGFRLWDAGFYPEARIALEDYLKDYPNHSRQSYARNLLGRAWLDDGKPASSVEIFLGNYQKDPRGARAPDSLLYLSQAMVELDKTEKACVVLDELKDVYPDVSTGRLALDVTKVRASAACK